MKNRLIIDKTRQDKTRQDKTRHYYFDFLRVIAVYGVIVNHYVSEEWETIDINSVNWHLLGVFLGLIKYHVPIFIMISGALFLSRDVPLRKIYSKYILRMFTAFTFWSLFYAMGYYVAEKWTVMHMLAHFVEGHYHLWFPLMISGMYAIIPFLKRITASEFLTKYFLILTFIFAFLIPHFIGWTSLVSPKAAASLKIFISKFHFNFVMGYTGYFILGYFLNKIDISAKIERVIYVLGILGFILTVSDSIISSHIAGYARGASGQLGVLCETIAIFIFFREHIPNNSKLLNVMQKFSKYVFGIYLVHSFVMGLIKRAGFRVLAFNPIFSAPVISLIILIISSVISIILNHIPVLKRYIV